MDNKTGYGPRPATHNLNSSGAAPCFGETPAKRPPATIQHKSQNYTAAKMSDEISVSTLLVFARTLVRLVPQLQEIGVTVQQLYEALKPVLLQKLQGAGIAIQGALASVIQQGGQLIYIVATYGTGF